MQWHGSQPIYLPPASCPQASSVPSAAAGPHSSLLPAGILLCPECPRWLVAHGRMEEAQAAAKRLWGGQAAEELAAIASEAIEATIPL